MRWRPLPLHAEHVTGWEPFAGAGAFARRAALEPRHDDRRLDSEGRVGEADLHPVHEVAPPRVRLPRRAESEEIPEEVRQVAEVRRIEAREAAARAPDARGSVPVVALALLRVGEHGVGLRRLLELLRRFRNIRVAIRMVLESEAAVGGLELHRTDVPRDSEHFVVVALSRHQGFSA